MEVVEKNCSLLNRLEHLESIAVDDVLKELISGLQLYSHVLHGEIYSTNSEADGTERSGSVSIGSENELEHSTELQNLRKLTADRKSNDHNLDSGQEMESQKIHKDLSYLLKIISNTRSELQSKGTFNHLREKVDEEYWLQKQESIMKSHLKSKCEDVKRVENEIAQFERESLEKEQKEMCQIMDLREELHLLKQQGETDKAFTKVWLTARNDEERLGQKDEILAKSSCIKSIRSQITRDCESYENVTAWTKLLSAKLEQKIRDWKNKSRSDIHAIEQKIEQKKKNIEEQQERIACLETTIGERMVELAPWDEEKVQERLQRLEHMRRYYSCRRIQRWWRMYMISHGLYKKKKPKPKQAKATKSSRKGK